MVDMKLALLLARASNIAYMTNHLAVAQAFSEVGFKSVWHFDHPDAHACLAVGPKFAVVATCGTRIEQGFSMTDFAVNLAPGLLPSKFGGRLHAGYGDAAKQLFSGISKTIDPLEIPTWWTGHSMGGTVTTIMLLRAAAKWGQSQDAMTFGAPRPGDADFCRNVGFSALVRFVHASDFAPCWPWPDEYAQPPGERWLHDGRCEFVLARPGIELSVDDHSINQGYIPALEQLNAAG